MKRYGNLYDKVISLDNLRLAEEKARKGKAGTRGVELFDRDREGNLLRLHEALLTRTFKTSKYNTFTIHDPKERVIHCLPYYPDRILHHAIMNIVGPIWGRTLTDNSFCCVKGKGIRGCADHISRAIRSFDGKPLYCLKTDISKFYPSVRHDVAKAATRRKIKDKDLLALIDGIIDSTDGLPIGNYLSQHLANLILAGLMHWIEERLPREIGAALGRTPRLAAAEYADDIVLLSDDKEALHMARRLIGDYLRERLGLRMKGNWQVFPIADSRADKHGRALDYVGYQFFRKQRLMRKEIKQTFCRKVAKLNRRKIGAREYKREIAPWIGWAKHSNSRNLIHKIIRKDIAI